MFDKIVKKNNSETFYLKLWWTFSWVSAKGTDIMEAGKYSVFFADGLLITGFRISKGVLNKAQNLSSSPSQVIATTKKLLK